MLITNDRRTITDVPGDDRKKLRDHIEGAIRLADEHDIGFLSYLLEMAAFEAHWSHDLKVHHPRAARRAA